MTYYYRSPRGGIIPLSKDERANLLELYGSFRVSVREIAETYGVGTSTIYRWLAQLGVKPQSEMSPRERAAFDQRVIEARRTRVKSAS